MIDLANYLVWTLYWYPVRKMAEQETENVVNKDFMMDHLKLEPLEEEGGFYSIAFVSPHKVTIEGNKRPAMSTIYYMLSTDSALGFMHKNRSDIMRYYQLGLPVLYLVLYPDGNLEETILGPDLESGHKLQLLTPGGTWVCTTLVTGEPGKDFGLVSEAVTPGFDPVDREIATMADVPERHVEKLKYFVRGSS